MSAGLRWCAALATLWLAGCSLFNSTERAAPERRDCDGGECEEPCSRCAPEASCERDAGVASCRCPTGTIDSRGDGSRCEPSAECERDDDCGPAAHCQRRDERSRCVCDDGYAQQGGSCRNIDECARAIDDCGAATLCVDQPGSFTCECRDGYAPHGDGRTCDNIDECEEPSACGENALCADTPGSHTCSCPAGYEGDPYTGCRDRGECANGTLSCPAPTLCRDQDGPDRCACPRYMRDVDGSGATCVDDRIVAGMFFDSRAVRLADTPAFVEAAPVSEEAMTVFTDGTTPPFALCAAKIFELYEAGSLVEGAFRLTLDSAGSCEALYDIDAGLFLGAPFDALGDGLGNFATLHARLSETGELLCGLQRRGPGVYDVVELTCPVARAVADAVGGALRADAAADMYLLIAVDSAGVIGEQAYDAPPGVGAILSHVSSKSVLWLSAFVPARAGNTVSVEAFAVDAEGNSYIYGRSDGDAVLGPAGEVPGPAAFLVALDRDGALVFRRSSTDATGLPEIRALASGPDGKLAALVAQSAQTIALARFDPQDGHELVRHTLGSGAWLAPQRLALDAHGGAVITGLAAGDALLGDEWQRGDPDVNRSFVAAYDEAGGLVLQRAFEGIEALVDLAVQPSGTVYLAGRFTPPIDLGGGVTSDTGKHFTLQLRPYLE